VRSKRHFRRFVVNAKDLIQSVVDGSSTKNLVDEVTKKELIARFKGKMKKPFPKDKDGDGKVNEDMS